MKRYWKIFVVMAVFALVLQSPGIARAQFVVDWELDAQLGPPGGFCTPAPADCTLRQAIIEGNNTVPLETITFDPAVFPAASIAMNASVGILSDITLDASALSGPVTIIGGGVNGIFWTGAPVVVTMTNLNVTGGSFSGGDGGAFRGTNASLIVNDSTLSGHTASNGGAIDIIDGTLTLNTTTISGNTATTGNGGGINLSGATTTFNLNNSTISGNAAVDGGGIYNDGGTVNILNSTISGNTSSGVGAATVAGTNTPTLTVENSIIANDTAGVSCDHVPGTQTNNIDSGTSCGWGSNSGSLNGTDPLLGALGNFDGQKETMPLLPGSPAIDAGNATSGAGTCLGGTDQRGFPLRGSCDIGAFESQGFTVSVTSGDSQSTPVGTAFPAPLVVGIVSDSIGVPETVNGGIVEFRGPASGAGTTFGGFVAQSITGVAGTGSATLGVTANTIAGAYNVTADTNGNSGAAVSYSLANTAGLTTTTIDADTPDPSYPGETVTVDVTVTSALSPTGSVAITGADENCAITLESGAGSCDVVFTVPGDRTLTATYSGDTANGGSVVTEPHVVFFPPGDWDLDGSPDLLWRDLQRTMTLVSYFTGVDYSGVFRALERVVPAPWEMAAADDFNGDGSTDLLWRDPVTGVNVLAYYQDTTLLSFRVIKSQGPEWRAYGTGDVNKDRSPDIFWYNTQTLENEAWYMSDATFVEAVALPRAPAPWVPQVVGDFDNDTNPDVIARSGVTGRIIIAYLNATNLKSLGKLPVASTGWEACGTIDMSGDFRPDIVWRDPMTGDNEAWIIVNGSRTSTEALPRVPPPFDCMAGHK